MITLLMKNENKKINYCRCSRIIHPSFLTLNDRESNELSLSGGGKLVIVEQKVF